MAGARVEEAVLGGGFWEKRMGVGGRTEPPGWRDCPAQGRRCWLREESLRVRLEIWDILGDTEQAGAPLFLPGPTPTSPQFQLAQGSLKVLFDNSMN